MAGRKAGSKRRVAKANKARRPAKAAGAAKGKTQARRPARGKVGRTMVSSNALVRVLTRLESACDHADELLDDKEYTTVLELLGAAIAKAEPMVKKGGGWASLLMGNAYSHRGGAYRGLERYAEAIADFERSASWGDDYGMLNLLATYEDLGKPEKVVERAGLVDEAYLDDYCRFWTRHYLGRAHLRLGQEDKALLAFKAILDDWASLEPQSVHDLYEGLEELKRDGGELAAGVDRVLRLFEPVRGPPSPGFRYHKHLEKKPS